MISAWILAAVLATAPLPDTVYVTAYGTRFHRCCHESHVVAVTLADAQEAGYTPCLICFPDKPKKVRPWDKLKRRP